MRVRCPKCGKKMERSYRDPFLVIWSCDKCNHSLILQYRYNLKLHRVGLYTSLSGVGLQIVSLILSVTISQAAWLAVWLAGLTVWGIGMVFLGRKEEESRALIDWSDVMADENK